ncbi:MAG: guanylate cyclase [Chloroflexi bacterium]|nr:MAG: guanylate cyclase [Chloroflexota bacterium]
MPERAETRRTVTVIFADVTGSTALGEGLDPESLRRVMERYFDAMRGVIERHGGVVEKFIGDAVMAVFGIPQLHEDDALRAVTTADAMREQLAALNEELARDHGIRIQMRTGVNTGEVVAGDPVTGQRLVTGDAVNVAARLEQAAQPGEILLGRDTHWLVRDVVRAEPLDGLVVKGKSQPIAAFRLLEIPRNGSASVSRSAAPLVGRQRELTMLRGQLAACKEGHACRLVTVLGAPGIGKSRLIWELVDGRGESGFVVGRCLPYGEGITYWPLVEIVKQIAGDDAHSVAALVADDGELVAERICAVVGQSEHSSSPEETFWAVRKLFEALARDRPLLVVLEDLEWAEPTFLDLIEYILGFSTAAPILLLAAARQDLLERRPSWTAPKANSNTLVLEPLSDDDSASLVGQLSAGAAVPHELRAHILETAEGNPLFLEQMLAMGEESDLTEVRIPPTIHALLAARIDHLDPDERAVIECASIEGRLFHLGAVAELAPPQVRHAVSKHVLTLVRKEFISPDRAEFTGDDAFRFGHILIRDAAYARIPKELRSALHERFATWLERRTVDSSREYEEIVGYHLEQAYRYRAELGPIDSRARALGTRAGELLGAAGERAVSRLDVAAASNLLDRALRVVPPGHPRRNELRLAHGDALVEAGELGRGSQILREVGADAAAAGQKPVEWQAKVRLAWTQILTQELPDDDAMRLATQAITELTPIGDNAGLACAWQLIAQTRNFAGNMTEHGAAMERALEYARRAGNARLETDCLFWIGLTAFFDEVRAEDALRTCAALTESAQTPLQHAHALFWLAAVRGLAGKTADVRVELENARRLYRELGLETTWGATSMVCGILELSGGDVLIAESVLREGAAVLEGAGEKSYRATVLALLGETLYMQARYEEAGNVIGDSRAITAPDDVINLAHIAATEARLAARRGAVAEADHAARDAVRELERMPSYNLFTATVLIGIADAFHIVKRLDDARDAASRALDLYERKGIVSGVERARALLAGLPSV